MRLNGFRDSLQKLMLDFEDSTNRGAAQVSVAGDKMRQSLGEFAETSEKIAGVRTEASPAALILPSDSSKTT